MTDQERARSMQVRMMVSTRSQVGIMAEMLGITTATFRKTYKKELTQGHDYIYAAISMKLVNSAVGGDMRAMLAWLRQFGGWQEITRRELTGKNGEPISIRSLDGPSLLALIEALGTKGAARGGKGGAPPQIDGTASDPDLDAVPGSADEGAEE